MNSGRAAARNCEVGGAVVVLVRQGVGAQHAVDVDAGAREQPAVVEDVPREDSRGLDDFPVEIDRLAARPRDERRGVQHLIALARCLERVLDLPQRVAGQHAVVDDDDAAAVLRSGRAERAPAGHQGPVLEVARDVGQRQVELQREHAGGQDPAARHPDDESHVAGEPQRDRLERSLEIAQSAEVEVLVAVV